MIEHAKNLRRTRADMLGTDDEAHYWECHAAAAYIEKLESALRGYVKATTGQESATVTFPMALEGEGK